MTEILIAATIAFAVGVFVGRILLKRYFKQYEINAKKKADLLLKEADLKAESLKQDRLLEAKEKFLKLKS